MRTRFTLAILLLAANAAAAEPQEPATESRWRLGAALGFGMRTNPLVQSDDIPIVVDIDVAWFGDHWFFDNGDIGLTFADNDTATASFVVRLNSDRVFFSKTDTKFVSFDQSGAPLAEAVEFSVPDRDYAAEFGLELLTDGDWGLVQAGAFHDVSGTHDGYEIYLNYSYGWRNQRWYLEPSIGAKFKSASLNDYYWGVREEEATLALPSYDAGSGMNTHARLMLSYQLSKEWSFSLVTEYERLNSDAADSPLADEGGVFAYFAGFGFRF